MANRLVIYDTSNFIDYPVGGQLTSIRNFLHYISDEHIEYASNILLVGVSADTSAIGKVSKIKIYNLEVDFLPVAEVSTDLSNVKKSLRLEYVKGLMKYRKVWHPSKKDCHYIHTPEAFGPVRMLCLGAHCYVFSHGSYINMWHHLRFFKKTPIIRLAFQSFLLSIIKKADMNFVLNEGVAEEYSKYSKNITVVKNSITSREFIQREPIAGRTIKCIFAGRLNEGKRIDVIIKAINSFDGDISLTVVGAGEEEHNLRSLCTDRINMIGMRTPSEVVELMKEHDILIMNSSYEGIPMTILEAMSCSMPIISTGVGGIPEAVRFGQDGVETDGTEESIIKAITEVVDKYNEYSINSWNHSKDYDYRAVNKMVLDSLNSMLKWY